MTNAVYDLCAVGNAMVDVLSHATDEFLAAQAMQKGAMILIDPARAASLYEAMGPGVESSGGSAGNTVAGFASFGGRAAYIGKVADDQLGAVFRHDLKAMGVHFDTPPVTGEDPTGRCLVFVTPDAHRTMNTCLGAAVTLGPADIDSRVIAAAQVTYLEGYLFDPAQAKAAFRKAATIAHEAGRTIALTLSDSFCVERHRADFLELVVHHTDILFANEHEIMALYETATFAQAVEAVRSRCAVAVLTRSEKGSVIVAGENLLEVPARSVFRVVDTTGAGDQYAAGFLYGYTKRMDLAACGSLGALAAAEVISHMGPRPEVSYKTFLEAA